MTKAIRCRCGWWFRPVTRLDDSLSEIEGLRMIDGRVQLLK